MAVSAAALAALEAEWEKLTDAWDTPEAYALLSSSPPTSLPKSGPLHDLLARTRQIIRRAGVPITNVNHSRAFLRAKAAPAALTRIVGWLQKRPSQDLHSVPKEAEHDSDWFLCLDALCSGIVTLGVRGQDTFEEQTLLSDALLAIYGESGKG